MKALGKEKWMIISVFLILVTGCKESPINEEGHTH